MEETERTERIVSGNHPLGYRAVERFDSTWGDAWSKYIHFSKLVHLSEVVSYWWLLFLANSPTVGRKYLYGVEDLRDWLEELRHAKPV